MAEHKVEIFSGGDQLLGKLFVPQKFHQKNAHSSLLPAVLFCHGATDYKEHFYEFCRYLSDRGFIALALDMHGHGESGGARYHVRMDLWEEDVHQACLFLMEHPMVDSQRVAAFGFSSGGTAVLKAAISGVPFKALITLDATVRNVVSDLEAKLLKLGGRLGLWKRRKYGSDLHIPIYPFALANPLTHKTDAGKLFVKEDYFKKAYWRYPLPGALESLVVDLMPDISSIQIPVCVIHGAEDRLDSPETAKLFFDRLSGDKALHIIPENGHMGHLDFNKVAVMEATLDWLHKHL